MSDLVISNTTHLVKDVNPSDFIRPITKPIITYVSGFDLAITTFVLGGIFMLLVFGYIIFKYFGQPMAVAAKEGSIIQHFDTPKSAIIKDAIISSGACRYRNLKDGTLAVTTKSIVNIEGKNAIVTFSGLGISIPIPHMAAMTILSNLGVKLNLSRDEETGEYTYKLNKEIPLEKVVVSGYNFFDFREMLNQIKHKRFIPLMVESVENFVTKNISADYTERKIKVRAMLQSHTIRESFNYQLLIYSVVGFLMVLFTYMILYKN